MNIHGMISTEAKPLPYLFTRKTAASIWGKDDSKTLCFLKDTCFECEPKALATHGELFRKSKFKSQNI
jgi:hypothetical protein